MTLIEALRGEFTEINPSKLASPTSTNPIARAHFALIRELARMHVPQLSVSPDGDEFDDVADYLLRLAQAVDRHVLEVGKEVKFNALCGVDLNLFDRQMQSALEGFALHNIDAAAQAAREQQDEDADTDYRYDEARDGL